MTDTEATRAAPGEAVQKVVVVDGGLEMLGGLETMLHARRYDMLFTQSSDLAYSQIKKIRPNLVVLCGGIEALDSSQLLTMLKLDPDTRGIPLLSYSGDGEALDLGGESSRTTEDEDALPLATPGLRMN